MAVRDRPLGFRGGFDRWVSLDEVRELQRQISEIGTPGELAVWTEAEPLAALLGSGLGACTSVDYFTAAGRDGRFRGDSSRPLTDADRREVLDRVVLDLAVWRRHKAVVDHARARALSVAAALGRAGATRSLVRCPACDGPLDDCTACELFCHDHQAAQAADLAALLAAADDDDEPDDDLPAAA